MHSNLHTSSVFNKNYFINIIWIYYEKILFVLAATSIPFVANAEPKETMPIANVNTAIIRFAPTLCNKGFPGLVEEISRCYDTTSIKSPYIHECILADLTFTVAYLKDQNSAGALVKSQLPYTSPFLSKDAFSKRFDYYIKPLFKNKNVSNIYNYYEPVKEYFVKTLNLQCEE